MVVFATDMKNNTHQFLSKVSEFKRLSTVKIQVILGERVTPYMYLFLLYLIREKIRLKRQYYVPIDSKHFTFRDIKIPFIPSMTWRKRQHILLRHLFILMSVNSILNYKKYILLCDVLTSLANCWTDRVYMDLNKI